MCTCTVQAQVQTSNGIIQITFKWDLSRVKLYEEEN